VTSFPHYEYQGLVARRECIFESDNSLTSRVNGMLSKSIGLEIVAEPADSAHVEL